MRIGGVVSVLFASLLLPGLGAWPAAASLSCTYDPASHTVTADGTGPPPIGFRDGIFRDGDAIVVGYASAAQPYAPCGAATVLNTDTIIVRNNTEDIHLAVPMDLGPGFTDEPGSSDEIEMRFEFGLGSDGIELYPSTGFPGPRTVRMGTSGAATLINTDAGEVDGIDADITAQALDQVAVFLNVGGGMADDVRADGSDGMGGGSLRANLTVLGGLGDDYLVGGSGQDYLAGQEGDDTLDAAAASDAINGGPGAGQISAGDGGHAAPGGGEGGGEHP